MELSQVKANVRKMVSMGAPMEDIDGYIAAAGWTVDDVRNYNDQAQAQPTETEQSPYSAMDKVKYTLRAAGEAAPFGMGDLVAGYVGAQARNLADYTHGKDLKTKLQGAKRFIDYATPIGQIKMLKEGTFGKERADFIKEQEEFTKHHPWLNAVGEFVGGALTGGVGAAKNVIGKQGIKALMGAGSREGAKFGAIYGAGSGFTQDTDKLSAYDALKGAGAGLVGGAVVGGALPPVAMVAGKALGAGVKGAKAIGGKIAKILKKDAAEANQALGNAGYLATDLAPENKEFLKLFAENPEGTMAAIKSGDPLIAHANSLQLGKTKGAIVANENAEQAYLAAKRAFDEKKIAKGDKFADILLGENSGKEAVERIAEEARNKYQPIYEEVMKSGVVDVDVTNPRFQMALERVRKNFPEYNNLPDNHIRVIQLVKEEMDGKIGRAVRSGDQTEKRMWQAAKKELLAQADEKIPQYAEARKAFMTGKELEDFVLKGQDIKTLSIKDVESLAKSMSAEEKEAFKSGVADVVRSSLDKTQKEGADVIGKAFDLPLRRKLEILGIGSDDLINAIKKEMKTNANFRAVGYGSDTAVNLRNAMKFKGPFSKVASVVEAVTSPVRTIKSLAEVADNKLQQLSAEEIARLMFDPKALAEEAQKPQHQRKIAEILRKSKQSESVESISGYLGGKLKEKGGYAMKDLADNATTEKLLKPRDFVSENFVSEVDNFLKDNSISNYQKIDMGQIPWIYMANGLEEQPLRTNKLSIRKAMGLLTPAELKANPKWHNHNVPKNVIDKMPELIADPLAIFKSNTEKGKYIAVLDAQVKGDPVLAVISPGKDGGYTFMPTAYEKGSFANFVKNTQEANNVVYVDGKRSLLPHTHLQAVSVGNKDPKHSIATKEGLVKRYFENRKNLFKNSKAVDEEGKLIELYHGTDGDFDTFDMSKGRSNMDIKGAFFSPWELDAKGYGKNVRSFYLNLTNPADEQTAYKALRKYQGQNNAGEKAKQDLIRQGYDGVNNGNEEYIAFFPEQIKSVFNRGTFSPKTGNVYKSLIGGLGISQILKNKESK